MTPRSSRVSGSTSGALLLAVLTVVALRPVGVDAGVVVTENAPAALMCLANFRQQGIVHRQVYAAHSVRLVTTFDSSALQGADIVYLNGFNNLGVPQIDALETFVNAGGRLILASDHNPLSLRPLAARFGVSYGSTWMVNELAMVIDFSNPVSSGTAGTVSRFDALTPNSGLISSNSSFIRVATYSNGATALGYLKAGLGDVVFLTDLNTFDDGTLNRHGNQVLWMNLFFLEPDSDGDGVPDSRDNCPAVANPDQADADEDGVGDACDACPLDPANDADGDGVCGDVDACADSNTDPMIVIDGCETGVANQALGDGCTMADEIAEAAASAANHGAFVSAVAHLTNAWVEAGLLTAEEKGRVQRCSARADASRSNRGTGE